MKLHPVAAFSVFREIRRGAGDQRPLAIAGARELVPILARELRAGGVPSAVVEGRSKALRCSSGLAAGQARSVREARRRADHRRHRRSLGSLTLAEDIVQRAAGSGLSSSDRAGDRTPVGEDGTALAAKLPVLRPAVTDALIRSFSKKNGIISAAIFVPGVDMPILTLNQIRLVLRLRARARRQEIDRERAVELLGVVGAGFGFRAIARQLLDFVPFAGWAVKGADRLHRYARSARRPRSTLEARE